MTTRHRHPAAPPSLRGVAALEMLMIITVIFCFSLLTGSVWKIRKADIIVHQDVHRDTFAETIRLMPDIPPSFLGGAAPPQPPDFGTLPGMDMIWDMLGETVVIPEIKFTVDIEFKIPIMSDFGFSPIKVGEFNFLKGPPGVSFGGDSDSDGDYFYIDEEPPFLHISPPYISINLGMEDLLPDDIVNIMRMLEDGGLTVEELAGILGMSWPPEALAQLVPDFQGMLDEFELGLFDAIPTELWYFINVPEIFHEDEPFINFGPRHVKYFKNPSASWGGAISFISSPFDVIYYNTSDFSLGGIDFYEGGDPNKHWHKQDKIQAIDFTKHDKSRHLSIEGFNFGVIKGESREFQVDPYVGLLGEWEAFWMRKRRGATIGPHWTWMISPVVPSTHPFGFKNMRKWYANGVTSALDQNATNKSRSSKATNNDSKGFRKTCRLEDWQEDYDPCWD